MTHIWDERDSNLYMDANIIRHTYDAGPVCGCEEKYDTIQNYKPFIPGGVNPYRRTRIPDSGSLSGTSELPENLKPKQSKEEEEDLMFIKLPQYSDAYFLKKWRQCQRTHVRGCNCPQK